MVVHVVVCEVNCVKEQNEMLLNLLSTMLVKVTKCPDSLRVYTFIICTLYMFVWIPMS